MWFLNRVANPVVRAVLRSPLHRLLSGRLVLLGITGRRSGRRFELPVGYRSEGSKLVVTVGAPERKRWWRNVEGATDVTLLLQGRPRHGVAHRVERPGGGVEVHVELTGC